MSRIGLLELIVLWCAGLLIGIGGLYAYRHARIEAEHVMTSKKALEALAGAMPIREDLVGELEAALDSLPLTSELVVESRGWRVVRLDESSPLAKAGYQVGDLIPNDKLDATLATFSNPDHSLAQRIVRILNRVSH